MSHGDKNTRRQAVRPILVALNMRPRTGPTEAAGYLQRLAERTPSTLYARATGKSFGLPHWSPSAIYWTYAPLTEEELSEGRAELARAEAAGVTILTWLDNQYPETLKASVAPPPVLYVKGTMLPRDQKAVAIVGSRKAMREYMELAADLAYGLAKRGYTIVSGLARGVDGYAHRGALEAGGRTLAVLGSGIDVIYPPEHRELADAVAAQGAVLTFYPFGVKPEPRHFPARNWVIAGLCAGVVVVQGTSRGGAIITANAAAAMGKEVMAVPGPIGHPLSEGTHGLIRDGARLVTSAEEVIVALSSTETEPTRATQAYLARCEAMEAGRDDAPSPPSLPLFDDSPEARILELLERGTQSVEELADVLGMGIGQAQAAITRLEIQGSVVMVDAGRYRLARRSQSRGASLRL